MDFLFGKRMKELCNLPLAASTARDRPRPSGNGIDIQPLPEQALNIVTRGTAAVAHDFICRVDLLRRHGFLISRQ